MAEAAALGRPRAHALGDDLKITFAPAGAARVADHTPASRDALGAAAPATQGGGPMFTGIVEETGRVTSVPAPGRAGRLAIKASRVLEGTRIGDSIAVNGVCLTATELLADGFAADVMPQTLSHSNLGALRAGSPVNLERAMAADGRFGGHIVSGHIDGTGTVRRVRRDQNAVRFTIGAPAGIMALIVAQGLHRRRRHQPDGGRPVRRRVRGFGHPAHGCRDHAWARTAPAAR